MFRPGTPANNERKKKERVIEILGSQKKTEKNCFYNKKETFQRTLDTGLINGWDTSKNDWEWNDGLIFCRVCSRTVTHARHMGAHIKMQVYERKKVAYKQNNEASLQAMVKMGSNPIVVSPVEKVYRTNRLKTIAMVNISLSALSESTPFLDYCTKEGLRVGWARDLVRLYSKPVRESLVYELQEMVSCCYNHFSIILDGTLSLSGTECVLLRVVTKDFEL